MRPMTGELGAVTGRSLEYEPIPGHRGEERPAAPAGPELQQEDPRGRPDRHLRRNTAVSQVNRAALRGPEDSASPSRNVCEPHNRVP